MKVLGLWIFQMNSLNSTIDTLSESRKLAASEVSRECLIVQKKQVPVCNFLSNFCPKTNSPLFLLHEKLVFSSYKSVSLNLQGYS